MIFPFLAGQKFAAGHGLAEALPTLDWETYSEAGYAWDEEQQAWKAPPGVRGNDRGLDLVGLRNYVTHPSFAITSLSYDLLDGRGNRHWAPPADLRRIDPVILEEPAAHDPRHPWDLLEHAYAYRLLEAWNASFERTVWNYYCAPVWGWPYLPVEQTRCAMAKARVFACPGKLDNVGKVITLPPWLRKDPGGALLMKKFAKPHTPTKKDPRRRITPEQEPIDGPKWYSYNKQDVVAEIAASIRIPDQPPFELDAWFTDQKINERGIYVDMVGVDNCIRILLQAEAKYNAELHSLTNGMVSEASELPSIRAWLATRGIHAASLAEESIHALLLDKLVMADKSAQRVLEIRQLLGSASVKKLFAFKFQSNKGRLYDLYSYFAARTGRWTGNGPQPQNLPKGFFKTVAECERALGIIASGVLELVEYHYPDRTALEVISSCLRGLLIAAPGYDLICSDYSAIEGVMAAALAGEEWRLEVFRTHGMIYETSASRITKVPFQEFVNHKLATGKHHPMRNQIGKYAELACGFGGWVGAMINFGADEFLSEKEMKSAILEWRKASPWIVEMWGGQKREVAPWEYREELYGLEGCAISAVLHPGKCYSYRNVSYQMRDDILYCQVPSGGLLHYHRPRLQKSTRDWAQPWEFELSYEGENKNPKMGPIGWVRMSLYGGKAFENVVQKEARTVMAHGLVNLEKRGYRPVLHSHDEPMGEVPEGWGSVEEFESIINDLPAFAKGFPIFAKGGWRGKRYGKFD